ncbi:hypothetical protein IW140_003489 [Coemansia sp. RSA 1813]|nr:hypothetical protein EV178_003424 [Coemansia sp. RSA 1646]KAJ1772907.1 hypothetical protein LPJ74_001045 [Coemansia sp. RSA 1843]KAJ2093479.1 hypothetical protein IW138_000329 [Coemansia sp. RSA 986]KAJ2214298.1 hypothetical protein EV179_003077 [Coemansia sp. RSA 487]KAJ2568866.1 hypothetical protein IW140_003489 [Coemansia sp. RSA 1813]
MSSNNTIQQQNEVDVTSTEFWQQKQEWAKNMRLQFSRRPEFPETENIIDDKGMLNQQYFEPPKDAVPQPERKWGDEEKIKLLEGIEKYGIGHFREISETLLPEWSGNDLRMKAIRIMGRQNLQLYKEWKGDKDAVKREYERNKEIGLRFGTWKGGALVYDDDGHVLKAIEESNLINPP